MNGLHASIELSRGELHLAVDLAIEPNETVVLVGPNGAGKSTIIEAIAGLTPIDRGHIVLAGRVVDDPESGTFVAPAQRQIGVVFQHGALFEHLDVRDNVGFGLVAAGSRRRPARRQAQAWLERFGLEELAGRRPSTLSGGEAQRVALARTLATEPAAVLLDEPFAAVDIGGRGRLRSIVAEHLQSFGGPRLVVTHDPTDVYLLADRVIVVEAGTVTQTGTPEEVRRHPNTTYSAALAGTNLLRGNAQAGVVRLDATGQEVQIADTHASGPVVVTIAPNAIVLHDARPSGSARNVWETSVGGVAPLGDVCRVSVEDPVGLAVDVTPASVHNLGLVAGRSVWVSIKATEITVRPDDGLDRDRAQ